MDEKRTIKDRFSDFLIGMLLVLWYVISLTFPAFHFDDLSSRKAFAVSFIVPPMLLILVFIKLFKKYKTSGNLWTSFFFPEFGDGTSSREDKLLYNFIGWCGILIAPSLGSIHAEKFIYGSSFSQVYFIGIIPVILAGGILIYFSIKRMGNNKLMFIYAIIGSLMCWWTWAQLLNIMEIAYRAPWVFTDMPSRLQNFIGLQ